MVISLWLPSSVIDFNMKTKEKVVLKEQQVLGENLIKQLHRGTGLGYCARWYKSSDLYGLPKRYGKEW
jgi:hypothetical protein